MRNFTPASVLAVAVWRIARITGSIFAASEDIRGGGGTLAEDCRSQADAWPETGVQSEGRIDDHGSDFILSHSSKPALLSTAGERKIFAPFWDLNLDTPAWAGPDEAGK